MENLFISIKLLDLRELFFYCFDKYSHKVYANFSILNSSPDSSESSEDSSSSSDSDDSELAARLIPANLRRPSPSTSTSTATTTGNKSKNARKRQAKKNAASGGGGGGSGNDSDLSDDDVNTSSAPKTEHEVVQPIIELPKLSKLPEESILTNFGKIMSVIDTVVVIKADTAGDWRVLDEGCICCWEDKTVIGNVS